MPSVRISPRQILVATLDHLNPQRLRELAVQLGVDPDGNDASIRKRFGRTRIDERRLIDRLSLYELGDVCRALELPSHGTDADALRGRLLGVESYQAGSKAVATAHTKPRDAIDVPEVLRGVAKKKRRTFLKLRLGHVARKIVDTLFWAGGAATLTYLMMGLLTGETETRQEFAAISMVAAGFVKMRRCGRFGGLFFYGVTMIAATYVGFQSGLFDLEMATHSRLSLVWGVSIVLGALMGIAEEIGGDMKR